jgi:hypothetical protein
MALHFKALIYILICAAPAFYLARAIASHANMRREFSAWRNIWFLVTVTEFLIGNFFVFAAFIGVICIYSIYSRVFPCALYFLLLFAVPSVVVTTGFGDIETLIPFTNARVISFALLLPALFAFGGFSKWARRTFSLPDYLVICYALLTIALDARGATSATQVLRFTVLQTLDILIPYFAMSRLATDVTSFREVFLAIVVTILPLSLVAVLETLKSWHLYESIGDAWTFSTREFGTYYQRGGILRATATAGQPIIFGFISMVAIGCAIAVRNTVRPRLHVDIALAMVAVGLLTTLSRGPLVGTVVLLLVYSATGPKATGNISKLIVGGILVIFLFSLTPVGNSLLDFLPLVGSGSPETLTYRQRLLENSFPVIERNLWFGSTDYLQSPEMRDLVQGEGIVDIVNSYLRVALNTGVIGLTLFVSIFLSILLRLRRVMNSDRSHNPEFNVYLRTIAAILAGMLITIGTVSSVGFIPYVYWAVAGLAVALVRIAYKERTTSTARNIALAA